MLTHFNILQTKLHPPAPRPSWLARPALLRRLDAALDRSVILVSAPPGYGKTTLIAAWLQGKPSLDFAWLTLDEDDHDPIRFFTNIVAAIQIARPGFGESILSFLRSPQPPSTRLIVTALINELLTLNQPLWLVVDDFSRIHDDILRKSMQLFFDNLPPLIHIILTTQDDSALFFARVQMQGNMLELRAADLRLSDAETAAFFEHIRITLTPEVLGQISRKVDGWVTGLQLVALSVEGHPDAGERIAAAAEDYFRLASSLMNDLVSRQPEAVRDFLMQTSILDRMCGELCNAITGRNDSQAMLEQLERANLFVMPLDSEQHWFRYQPVFRTYLKSFAETRLPREALRRTYGKVARWYASENQLPQAIDSALHAEDYRLADNLIEAAYDQLLAQGAVTTLINWFKRFHQARYEDQGSYLQIRYAGVLVYHYPYENFDLLLDLAERSLINQRHPRQKELLGWVSAIRAVIAARDNRTNEAISFARRAFDLLGEKNPYVRSLAHLAEGIALLTNGAFSESVAACSSALDRALAAENPHLAAVALCYIGNDQILLNDLPAAREAFERAMALLPSIWRESLPGIVASAGLAHVAYEQGNLTEAAQWAEVSPDDILAEIRTEPRMIYSVMSLVRIRTAIGDHAGSVDLLHRLKTALDTQRLSHLMPQEVPPAPLVHRSPAETVEALSERELEVLRLIDAGLTNQEIADRLVIALGTVKKHISNLFDKLGATNRTQALARAREYGIL